jgi:IS5 family transposase
MIRCCIKLDWDWLDDQIAPLYSDQGRPGIETRFVIGPDRAIPAQAHFRTVG